MVVNYDVPIAGAEENFRPDLETYIHRIGELAFVCRFRGSRVTPGRTGRFGRKGCSVIFVHDERSKDEVNELMARQGRPMKKIDATSQTDLDALEKVS
jgi:ATP-dependent RNA helicase DDX19/DBP5